MGYLSNIDNTLYIKYDFTITNNNNEKTSIIIENSFGNYYFIRIGNYYITIVNNIFTLTKESNTYFYTNDSGFIHTLDNKVLSCFGDKLNVREKYSPEDENNLKDQIIHSTFKNNIEKLLGDGKIIIKNKFQENVKMYLLNSCHNQISNAFEIPGASDLLNNSQLFEILNCVWGENNWHLTTFSSTRLMPNVKEGNWHVDYPYTSVGFSPVLGIQVIIPIDSFTDFNGSTEYIEGTHIFENGNLSNFLKFPVKLTMKSDNMLIMLGNVVHRSGANNSELPRCALLANFSPLEIPPKDIFKFVNLPFKFVNGYVKI